MSWPAAARSLTVHYCLRLRALGSQIFRGVKANDCTWVGDEGVRMLLRACFAEQCGAHLEHLEITKVGGCCAR